MTSIIFCGSFVSNKIGNALIFTNSAKIAATYKSRLQGLVSAQKKYPARAKRRGDEGVVRVSFVVLANGTISQIQIVKSSGSAVLDNAAKKILSRISGKLPFPQGMQKKQWRLTLPLTYRLN